MMMTLMRKRRIPAVQTVIRKRKLDPEDLLLEGKSGALAWPPDSYPLVLSASSHSCSFLIVLLFYSFYHVYCNIFFPICLNSSYFLAAFMGKKLCGFLSLFRVADSVSDLFTDHRANQQPRNSPKREGSPGNRRHRAKTTMTMMMTMMMTTMMMKKKKKILPRGKLGEGPQLKSKGISSTVLLRNVLRIFLGPNLWLHPLHELTKRLATGVLTINQCVPLADRTKAAVTRWIKGSAKCTKC